MQNKDSSLIDHLKITLVVFIVVVGFVEAVESNIPPMYVAMGTSSIFNCV